MSLPPRVYSIFSALNWFYSIEKKRLLVVIRGTLPFEVYKLNGSQRLLTVRLRLRGKALDAKVRSEDGKT